MLRARRVEVFDEYTGKPQEPMCRKMLDFIEHDDEPFAEGAEPADELVRSEAPSEEAEEDRGDEEEHEGNVLAQVLGEGRRWLMIGYGLLIFGYGLLLAMAYDWLWLMIGDDL